MESDDAKAAAVAVARGVLAVVKEDGAGCCALFCVGEILRLLRIPLEASVSDKFKNKISCLCVW